MSDDEFDAGAFAKRAAGEEPTSSKTSHATAEGAEDASGDPTGSTSTLRDMLMSTEPSPTLDEVESPWDPDKGGPTRVKRGIQKMLGFDGIPAVLDISIGGMEWWSTVDVNGRDQEESDDDQDDELPAGMNLDG